MSENKLYLANDIGTNLYETRLGVLNIAPTKISGQYKIVVDTNRKLWLDDYTGRRVAVDKNVSFLQQVANFLQVRTDIVDISYLRYGGHQRSTNKAWHIPFYFGANCKSEQYPRYYVLSRVPNETFNHVSVDPISNQPVDEDNDNYQMKFPYKYGKIIDVIDLKEIGLHDIMDEIQSENYFKYPLYFNWEDNSLTLFGYSINKGYPALHKFDITKYVCNQAYLDVFNNKILNTFVDQQLFYPRFLNIEFEFDYINERTPFNNFMGFLSLDNNYADGEYVELDDKHYWIKIQDKDDSRVPEVKLINWQQINYYDNESFGEGSETHVPYTLDKYLNRLADGTINEVSETRAQYKFRTYRTQVGDTITIDNPSYNSKFTYTVKESDIRKTLYQTWIAICNNCTKQSGVALSFKSERFINKTNGNEYVEVSIVNNNASLKISVDEDVTITIPTYYEVIDRFDEYPENKYKFRGITDTDICLCGQPTLVDTIDTIEIPDVTDDDKFFKIVERFKYQGTTILRLDRPCGIRKVSRAYIYENLVEEIVRLEPINWLTYYSPLTSEKQYDFNGYKNYLKTKFYGEYPKLPDDASIEDIEAEEERQKVFLTAFDNFQQYEDDPNYNYVEYNDETKEYYDKSHINYNLDNENTVLNILFNTMGNSAYMIPDILNIDRQFWIQSGNINSEDENDKLKFNWFLINANCPDYYIGTINEKRYLTRTPTEDPSIFILRPKITSRLIRVSDSICETVFLGVKYQLPVEYADWEFCVYLNPNKPQDTELYYRFDRILEEKLLMFSINKYIDFNDLIRGGDDKNQPIIDLSFFYNITNSSNNSSDYLDNYKSAGLKVDVFYNHKEGEFRPLYDRKLQSDWRHPVTNQICLRKDESLITGESLKDLFPESGDFEFYVYGTVKYPVDNVLKDFNYISMVIKLYNISNLNDDYLWVDDIKVRFFDTKHIFLHRVKEDVDLSKEYRNPAVEEILYVDKKNIVSYMNEDDETTYGDRHQITTIIVDNQYQKFKLLCPERTISFKEDYFEIHQRITENIDGTKNYLPLTVFKFEEQKLEDDDIIRLFNDNRQTLKYEPINDYDTSVYSQMMTMFDRNQLWRIVNDLLQSDLKFRYLTKDQVRDFINQFTVTKLQGITNVEINNVTSNDDKYIPITVVDIDKNLIIWNDEQPKVNLANRQRTAYAPYMEICDDMFEFQINNFKQFGTLFNMYDNNFGNTITGITDYNVSATGLWKELTGNVISTLYCKESDIMLAINFQTDVNYRDLLIGITNYNDCIITNDNSQYIQSLNKNQEKYIKEQYVDMMLSNFYKLDHVENELGMTIKYTEDSKIPCLLHFADINKFGVTHLNYHTLKIILKRR